MVELRGRERKERRIEQSRSSLEYEDLKVNPVHTCSCHEQTVFPTSFAFDLIGRDRGQLRPYRSSSAESACTRVYVRSGAPSTLRPMKMLRRPCLPVRQFRAAVGPVAHLQVSAQLPDRAHLLKRTLQLPFPRWLVGRVAPRPRW